MDSPSRDRQTADVTNATTSVLGASGSDSTPSGWLAVLGVLVCFVAGFIGVDHATLPSSVPADVGPVEFSARRAIETLERVLGDLGPHPAGTPAHDAVRANLLAELDALGLEATVDEGFALGPYGYAAVVRNVLARIPGANDQAPAVLLMAHYDSEGQSPGAGDDGSGVAILLEAARALLSGPPPPRPVVLLFSDAEEAGLVGAVWFCRTHPWFEDVAVAVNAEARGTAGPSRMFQTYGDNGWLIRALARAAPRTHTSSVSDLVYKSMPNDTDLTVLGGFGVPGLNFAFIRGLSRYHTARDDLAHLSPESVQEQGESMLGLARELGAALEASPGGAPTAGSVVYTDILSLGILAWPIEWTIPLAVLAVVLALVGLRVGAQTRAVSLGSLALGWLACLLTPLLAAGATWVWLRTAADTRGVADPGVASPYIWASGLLALIALVTLVVNGTLARATGFAGSFVATWLLASCGALVTAIFLPEVSYLLLLPAFAAGVVAWPCGVLRAERPERDPAASRPPGPGALGAAIATLVTFTVTALVWLPVEVGLQYGFGFRYEPWFNPTSLALPLAVVGLSLGPWLALGRWLPLFTGTLLCLLSWLGATGLGLTLETHTPDDPSWINVRYIMNAEAGSARWDVSTFGAEIPPELAEAAGLQPTQEPPFPWLSLDRSLFAGPAPMWDVIPPTFEVESSEPVEGGRIVRGRLRSPRGTSRLHLRLPAHVDLVAAAWRDYEIRGEFVKRHGHIFCAIPPEDGLTVELFARGEDPFEVWILDEDWTLPPEARTVLAARPPWAVPRGDGDVSIVGRRVEVE